MPGLPGSDFTQTNSQLLPAGVYSQTGIDPNWTQLAMALGYVPNMFPRAGTEGQDQLQFLATLKGIMDNQLGGPQGVYSQMSPGNPIAAMPYAMRQALSAAGALMNSYQSQQLFPNTPGAQTMFANGYQFGGIPDMGTPSPMQQPLINARGGGTGGASSAMPPGPIPVGAGAGANPALPAAGQSSAAAPPQIPSTNTQMPGAGADVAGPPSADTTGSTANADIVRGLMNGAGQTAAQVAGGGANPAAPVVGNLLSRYMSERGFPNSLIQQAASNAGQAIPGGGAQIPLHVLQDFASWLITQTAGRLPNAGAMLNRG